MLRLRAECSHLHTRICIKSGSREPRSRKSLASVQCLHHFIGWLTHILTAAGDLWGQKLNNTDRQRRFKYINISHSSKNKRNKTSLRLGVNHDHVCYKNIITLDTKLKMLTSSTQLISSILMWMKDEWISLWTKSLCPDVTTCRQTGSVLIFLWVNLKNQ